MKKIIISCVEETLVDIIDNDKYYSYPGVNVKAEELLGVIDERLGKNGFRDVDEIFINVGPGSFTGIRAGLSLIFGLTAGKNIKIIPFTTFDMFEYNKLTAEKILAVTGFSNFVYSKKLVDGKVVMECEEYQKLVDFAKLQNATIYSNAIKVVDKFNEFNIQPIHVSISLENVIKKYNAGQLENRKVEPVYLRLSQAEIQKKENKK